MLGEYKRHMENSSEGDGKEIQQGEGKDGATAAAKGDMGVRSIKDATFSVRRCGELRRTSGGCQGCIPPQ